MRPRQQTLSRGWRESYLNTRKVHDQSNQTLLKGDEVCGRGLVELPAGDAVMTPLLRATPNCCICNGARKISVYAGYGRPPKLPMYLIECPKRTMIIGFCRVFWNCADGKPVVIRSSVFFAAKDLCNLLQPAKWNRSCVSLGMTNRWAASSPPRLTPLRLPHTPRPYPGRPTHPPRSRTSPVPPTSPPAAEPPLAWQPPVRSRTY